MSILFVVLSIWLLSGIFGLCLDILVSGKPSVMGVFWALLLGLPGLVMFITYLIIVTVKDYYQNAPINKKNNLIAIGVFTIIALFATVLYYCMCFINS